MNAPASVFDSQEFVAPNSVRAATTIDYRIDVDRRTVHVTLAGEVSNETLRATYERVTSDPRYAPGMNLCVECRVMTSVPSDGDIRAIALRTVGQRAAASLGRIAIVAMTERSYEAASVFELYADAPQDRLGLFTDPVAARAWLSLDR